MTFADLSKRAQVNRLRPTAQAMLRHYPIEVERVRLVTHLYNTTFRVDTKNGQTFALRVNTNSERTPEEMNAEVAWVDALARETDLWVPAPQKTVEGTLILDEWNEAVGRNMRGVLYSWLPGANVGDRMNHDIAYAMGEATAKMHRHGYTFKMPRGASLKGMTDALYGYPYELTEKAPNFDHALFERALSESTALIARLGKLPQIPIHNDLHMWNAKWTKGKMSVFDFDDTILGLPIYDAYVTVFYLRGKPDWADIEAAYFEGLGTPATGLNVTKDEFELLVASRALLMANELFRWNHPEMNAIAPRYAEITEKRLRHFYDTGIFDPMVAPFK